MEETGDQTLLQMGVTEFILAAVVVVLVLMYWPPVAVVETQAQLAHLLEELSPEVMAEGAQETVKMVLQPQELGQVEFLEMVVMALEPIFYLDVGVEAEARQRLVSQEEQVQERVVVVEVLIIQEEQEEYLVVEVEAVLELSEGQEDLEQEAVVQ